jgi:hypothetical protein
LRHCRATGGVGSLALLGGFTTAWFARLAVNPTTTLEPLG